MKEVEINWPDGCAFTSSPFRTKSPQSKLLTVLGRADHAHWNNCPVTPRFRSIRMALPICSHCGRPCGDLAGGWGSINGEPLCHPNEENRPDCYRLVTVYHHPLGHEDCEVTNGVKGARDPRFDEGSPF